MHKAMTSKDNIPMKHVCPSPQCDCDQGNETVFHIYHGHYCFPGEEFRQVDISD